MLTIKDIALAAGVSVGTVSNVLNGKTTVSLTKIKQVEEAIARLGYQRNGQAARLKNGDSRRIALIMPNMQEVAYHRLFEALSLLLESKGYRLDLYLSFDLPEKEQTILQGIVQEHYFALLSVPTLSREHYQALFGGQAVPFFFLLRGEDCFSPDYSALFPSIYTQLSALNCRHCTLVAETLSGFTQSEAEQLKAFLAAKGIAASIRSVEQLNHSALLALSEKSGDEAILIPSLSKARQMLQIYAENPPLVLSFSANHSLPEPNLHLCALDFDTLARQIVGQLFPPEAEIEYQHHAFCSQPLFTAQADTLNLLAVPSPSITALSQLLPQFTCQSGMTVNLHLRAFHELPNELAENGKAFDLVRIDMESLPYFAEYFSPLNQFSEAELAAYFPKTIVERFAKAGGQIVALPFDPSIQMLYYRKDMFENAKIKRHYYERYKSELTVPTTFKAFNQIAEFFSGQWEDNPFQAGTVLMPDDRDVLASEFLLRYYAYADTMFADNQVKLQGKAAENALKSLKELRKSSILLKKGWWKEAINEFASGQIPMGIVYMNHFAYCATENSTTNVAFAPVPHGMPLLGGGSLAIVKNSLKQAACGQFLCWFMHPSVHAQYLRLGGISAKNGSLPLVETACSVPYLHFAQNAGFLGIRENRLPNGEAVNLRHIEQIIGQYVQRYLNEEMSEKTAVRALNQALAG